MPSSPKTPRTPTQFDFGRSSRSGTRWHSRRRFFLLLSVVLLISSGSLIMLRLSVDPNSPNSPSWARSRLSHSPIRNNNNNDNNENNNNNGDAHAGEGSNQSAGRNDKSAHMYSNNPYLVRGGQRPRQALPHRNVFNDEKELALMMDQLELQEQQLRQLRQQILDQQKEIIELDRHQQVLQQNQEQPQPPKGQQEAQLQGLQHPSGANKDLANDHMKDTSSKEQQEQSPLQDSNPFESGTVDDGEYEEEETRRAALLEFSRENPTPFTTALEKKLPTARKGARGVRYLTYLPYAGITNQFYGMLRALEVAQALGRTLILPPITASSHDKSKQNQPWSRFLDLDRFRALTGAKVIEFHELLSSEGQHHEDTIQEYHLLQCKITCGFGSKRTIDFTAKGFLKQWHLQESLEPLQTTSKDDSTFESIVAALQPFKEDPYLCLSNTYKIAIKSKTEWDRFGQYLYFTSELEQFVQQFLATNNLVNPATSGSIQPYLAIHARRGDFAKYCEGNFPGPKMIHCLPSTSQFQDRIDIIQSDLEQAKMTSEPLPVFVATNERDPDELAQFAHLGWHVLDHAAMNTVESLGVFGPMMVDQVFMANAQVLVGIQMSTFSRVGALRQKSWHSREAEYM